MTLVLAALAVAAAYVLGSIPFGILVCRPLGKDPRSVGSGRTGGTNVYRTAGMPAALLTVAGDIAKGYAAVRFAQAIVPQGSWAEWAMALAALAAILGHNYSAFLGMRGGAGSTPNVGALLAFDPRAFGIVLVVAAIALFGIGVASIASITLSVAIAAAVTWLVVDGLLPPAALAYAVGQLALVLFALRPNIARLRAGTERRIDFGARALRSGSEEERA